MSISVNRLHSPHLAESSKSGAIHQVGEKSPCLSLSRDRAAFPTGATSRALTNIHFCGTKTLPTAGELPNRLLKAIPELLRVVSRIVV